MTYMICCGLRGEDGVWRVAYVYFALYCTVSFRIGRTKVEAFSFLSVILSVGNWVSMMKIIWYYGSQSNNRFAHGRILSCIYCTVDQTWMRASEHIVPECLPRSRYCILVQKYRSAPLILQQHRQFRTLRSLLDCSVRSINVLRELVSGSLYQLWLRRQRPVRRKDSRVIGFELRCIKWLINLRNTTIRCHNTLG